MLTSMYCFSPFHFFYRLKNRTTGILPCSYLVNLSSTRVRFARGNIDYSCILIIKLYSAFHLSQPQPQKPTPISHQSIIPPHFSVQQMNKRNNIINLGLNEVVGNITFGEGCIINPTCSIICEKKDENFKIIFGDYNIIQERAVIMFKPTSEKDNIMKIGSYNTFGIKSYVLNTQLGDGNCINARAEIKDGQIGNYNIIGSDTKITKKNIGSHFCIFHPGIMKEVDIIDDERIRENMRELYLTTKALQAKETKQ